MTPTGTLTVPRNDMSEQLYSLVRMMQESRGERCAALVRLEMAIDDLLDDNPSRFTNEHRRLVERLQRVRALVVIDDLEDHVEQMAMHLVDYAPRASAEA